MRSFPAAFAMVALLYQIVSDTHKPRDGHVCNEDILFLGAFVLDQKIQQMVNLPLWLYDILWQNDQVFYNYNRHLLLKEVRFPLGQTLLPFPEHSLPLYLNKAESCLVRKTFFYKV
jgi:hypothetical protein